MLDGYLKTDERADVVDALEHSAELSERVI